VPFLDEKTNSIYIRVVYDGAPESGKTTNLEMLTERISNQRRGKMHSPGTTSNKRTVYFDWLAVTGGFVEGRRLRCQLISVPGQAMLAARRSHLLDTADVVVFVADSRRSELDRNRAMISDLRERLGKRTEGIAPVSIMLQANKQDFDDALEPRELARALGLSPIVPAQAAIANENKGVLEVFMLAVRLAADRVRTYLMKEKMTIVDKEHLSYEYLLEQVQQVDLKSEDPLEKLVLAASDATAEKEDIESGSEPKDIPASSNQKESKLDTPRLRVASGKLADDALARAEQEIQDKSSKLSVSKSPSQQPKPDQRITASDQKNTPIDIDLGNPTRDKPQVVSNSIEAVETSNQDNANAEDTKSASLEAVVKMPRSSFPQPGIAAGCLWPPVTARAVLASVDAEAKSAVQTPGPWCPRGWLEWAAGDDWILHTHKAGVSNLAAARALLMDTLRSHSRLGQCLPDGRAIALTEDNASWRLWIISPNLETFDKTLSQLVVKDKIPELISAIHRVVHEMKLLVEKAADKRISLALKLENIAITRDSVTYLGEVRALAGNHQNSGPHQLLEELNEFLHAHPEVKSKLPSELSQELMAESS